MKNYIGFSRDHSASMRSIAKAAAVDYNDNIGAIKEAAIANQQDTIVSVVKCGVGSPALVQVEVANSSVHALQPLDPLQYNANGSSTPLFDSVGELIEMFEKVPDAKDETVSFLIMVITDGEENSSRRWSSQSLSQKMKQLQATDRWTFVFRVPRGAKRQMMAFGIPEGNILEWDQTQQGVEVATQATRSAFTGYFSDRAKGATKTETFYTNMNNVSASTIKATLTDISTEVSLWPVMPSEDGKAVREFCESRLGANPMLKGAAFYELTKLEKKVQDYKMICVRDKKTNEIFSGAAARDILGLPHVGDVKLAPGAHGNYDVFIQSTSVNRKVPAGSTVLYWPKVGVGFTEGPSSR